MTLKTPFPEIRLYHGWSQCREPGRWENPSSLGFEWSEPGQSEVRTSGSREGLPSGSGSHDLEVFVSWLLHRRRGDFRRGRWLGESRGTPSKTEPLSFEATTPESRSVQVEGRDLTLLDLRGCPRSRGVVKMQKDFYMKIRGINVKSLLGRSFHRPSL